jgi:voltage-gated potassium channel
VIWFSFAIEFILMVSIAENKLDYCKRNWLDIAIILLPAISFLRSLQTMRATRLAKLMRIQKLTQIARVYRLRGTAIKAFRALITLEIAHRMVRRDPDRAIRKLQRRLAEVEREAKLLRRRIARLRRTHRGKLNQDEAAAPNENDVPTIASVSDGGTRPVSVAD